MAELLDTDRELLPGSIFLGPSTGTIPLHIRLKPKNPVVVGVPITRADLPDYYADPVGVDAVSYWLISNGVLVTNVDIKARLIEGSCSPQLVSNMFGATLNEYLVPATRQSYRGRQGVLTVPDDLVGYIQSVDGLDTMVQTYPSMPLSQGSTQYLIPQDILNVYNVPQNVNGAGQTIGIIAVGGGFSLSVLQSYWRSMGILDQPTVTVVPVSGWVNNLNDGANTAELHMDIGIAGAMAPGAHIVVYAVPSDLISSTAAFALALSAAVHDDINQPDIISMSYAVFGLTSATKTSVETDLSLAASLGITFICSSGDWGSTYSERADHKIVFSPLFGDTPSYPQESPNALVVGGTSLVTNSTGTSITSETSWYTGTATSGTGFGSGGGVSPTFAKPTWQTPSTPTNAGTGFSGRAFPDIAGAAAGIWGSQVTGANVTWAGTSVTSPMFAGIIARVNQRIGTPVGFFNAVLYANTWATRDINNTQDMGHYPPGGAGWDIATGLGVPNFGLLIEALSPGTQTSGKASSSRLSQGFARPALKGINATSAHATVSGRGYAHVGGAILPAGAMDDFSCWQYDLADPLMTRVINSAHIVPGQSGLQRIWISATVPQSLTDASGAAIWKRAAYIGMGVEYDGIPAGGYGLHTHAQMEPWNTTFRTPTTLSGALPALFSSDPTGVVATIPLTAVPTNWPQAPFILIISRNQADQELFLVQYTSGTNVTGRRGVGSLMPAHSSGATVEVAELSAYEPARTINIRLRADRVNYVKNPSFETSLAYVGAVNASYTQTNAVQTQLGAYSLKVQANSTSDSFALELFELNPSTQMAWALEVLSPVGTWLDMTKMGLQEVNAGVMGRRIGAGTGLIPLPANTWTRVTGAARIPFDWGSETALIMRPPSRSDGSTWDTTQPLYYDQLLVEEGTLAGDYFDGSFNSEDYLWETDDTGIAHPHESRSYYYQGIHEKAYRVEQTVREWIPFGASYHVRYGTTPIVS